MTAPWGIEDPAAAEGSEAEQLQAFRGAYTELQTRVRLLTSLPLELLDRLALQRELHKIGGR